MTNLIVTMPEASLTSLWQRTISFSPDGNGASSWLCKEANKLLSEIEKELHETDLKVKPMIRKSVLLREILMVENEKDVSALVIGSYGRIPELRVSVQENKKEKKPAGQQQPAETPMFFGYMIPKTH